MRTTDAQVRKLMEEFSRQGKVGLAAVRSGMDRKTARKYLKAGKLPSALEEPRSWRTREDPFEEDWEEVRAQLVDAPELEAKALFEHLMGRKPDRYDDGQLRTFQRKVKQWRAQEGPPKEVYFAQAHVPGEALQTDFTRAAELGVTIGGESFDHLLCHVVLPYANWGWATVCRSESLPALRRGVQAAVFHLGKVPRWHQTDNSTAATHDPRTGENRKFNDEYLVLMRHLGMEPRTIGIGQSHQNGDVEALQGALKRRLKQHLILRGSRDFSEVSTYEAWVQGVLEQANRLRGKRLREELEAMRPVSVERLPEYRLVDVFVTTWSTMRVLRNIYSVPSRLIGESLRVRAYDDRLEVYHGGQHQMTVERMLGTGGHRIHYRHVIWSLIRKPGAFRRYRYREELFPTLTFRRAYDALTAALSERQADIEYLRLLHRSASTLEGDVEAALDLLLGAGELPRADRVKALVAPESPAVPELAAATVNLASYDELLVELGVPA